MAAIGAVTQATSQLQVPGLGRGAGGQLLCRGAPGRPLGFFPQSLKTGIACLFWARCADAGDRGGLRLSFCPHGALSPAGFEAGDGRCGLWERGAA